jgi:hypothetical protein
MHAMNYRHARLVSHGTLQRLQVRGGSPQSTP